MPMITGKMGGAIECVVGGSKIVNAEPKGPKTSPVAIDPVSAETTETRSTYETETIKSVQFSSC